MDYQLDTRRLTGSSEEKKKGWRQTGKADKSERQLKTPAPSALTAASVKPTKPHNRSHKVTGCKRLNPRVTGHPDKLGLVQSPATRLPLTAAGAAQSAVPRRARPKQSVVA